MKALERHRQIWPDKSDEWLYERLNNELKDKVSEIHLLLEENSKLRKEECDCEDYDNGLVSNYCTVHNENPYKKWE